MFVANALALHLFDKPPFEITALRFDCISDISACVSNILLSDLPAKVPCKSVIHMLMYASSSQIGNIFLITLLPILFSAGHSVILEVLLRTHDTNVTTAIFYS